MGSAVTEWGILFSFKSSSSRNAFRRRRGTRAQLSQSLQCGSREMASEEDLDVHDDLSLFHQATAKLSDAQKLTDDAHDLLKQDLEKVREEKSNFEKMIKTLNQVHFASTVKLNVGGKIYKTTLNTLRKDPDSMLCVMFSGRYEVKVDEEDGAYFIDRDGKLFR